MASTKISRAFSTATNAKKFTLSVWVKRSKLDSEQQIFSRSAGQAQLYISSANKLQFYDQTSGHNFRTTRLFRDVNAWYHIVVAVDTTQSTASNRNKIYINGVQETSFEVETNATQNNDTAYNISGITYDIGAYNNAYYWDGYMSHFHFIDGTMYTASPFGSTDASTGQWKITTNPSVTYGNNGFFYLKDGNSVTDQSGNSNNGTASGNLTNTEDCPSNIFDTFNLLSTVAADPTLSLGNTKVSTSTNSWRSANCSIGMSSGKYYFEAKVGTISMSNYCRIGIASENLVGTTTSNKFQGNYAYGVNWDGNKLVNSTLSSFTSMATNDIFGFAVDLDNNYIYCHRNGTYVDSGDPTSGSNGTGALSAIQSGQMYFISASVYSSNLLLNTGNGHFGTTAISSEGTNASNIGKFEYDVPAGYTALSTKGLNL
jgi:hypothetical protein